MSASMPAASIKPIPSARSDGPEPFVAPGLSRLFQTSSSYIVRGEDFYNRPAGGSCLP
jgi:hypothetical protein